MKPIEVKLTRAEKRGRKIILVIESDLYSDEVFAVTPFYNEGDKKNQLQDAKERVVLCYDGHELIMKAGIKHGLSLINA